MMFGIQTISQQPVPPAPPLSPANFDASLHSDKAVARRMAGNCPARLGLLAIASRGAGEITAALAGLVGEGGILAKGVRSLAYAALGNFEAIRPTTTQGTRPEDLEGMLYTLIAQAAAAEEEVEAAIAHLQSALLLARLLEMQHRAQWIALELERVRLLTGQARPEAVQEALRLACPSPARLAWAREIEGAALLSRGRYKEAAQVGDGGVREFALLLSGEKLAPQTRDSLMAPALMLAQLRRGERLPLASGRGEGYSGLLTVCGALLQGEHVPLPPCPVAPDQQVVWALLAWEMRAADPTTILHTLRTALPELDSMEPLAALLPVTPVALAALAYSPLRCPDTPDVPVIFGEYLHWENRQYKLPGRRGGGRALLKADVGLQGPPTRVERQRLRVALEKLHLPSAPVLASQLLDTLVYLAVLGDSAWVGALEGVTNQVDSESVRQSLRARYEVKHMLYA